MQDKLKLTAASLLFVATAASTAMAQGTLTGTTAINDQIDDISRDVNKDMARSDDSYRFGSPEYRMGLSGSASLGYTAKTGATDSQDFTLGARLRYAQGQLVQTIGVALDFEETGGVKTKEDVFAVYDANYYFNDSLYGFALGRVKTDGLANLATDTQTDAFIGFGPGYRIINTPNVAWRVQAGIGVSYLENGVGSSDTEMGYIASSRLYYRISDTIFATADTDFLKSDSALRIDNDLGVNFKVSDAFVTRISYLTDYNDSRAVHAENKFGLSLVYGF